MKILLILIGFFLLLLHKVIYPISFENQFWIFIFGLFIIGIPHGAADLMVACKNTRMEKKTFSIRVFLLTYLGRLFLFGCTLYFFPLLGILLFILFSAYHFGETDLCNIQSETLLGKILIISFGLVILSFVLMFHFEEVKPLIMGFNSGINYLALIEWLNSSRYAIIGLVVLVFFFCYLLYKPQDNSYSIGSLQLIELIINLFIVTQLPMILGFTYYFIFWHSILSLSSIIKFLKKDNSLYSTNSIILQIVFFGLLAIFSIGIFIYSKVAFININSIISYCFLGLAVLTAPHLKIMHDMYLHLRTR